MGTTNMDISGEDVSNTDTTGENPGQETAPADCQRKVEGVRFFLSSVVCGARVGSAVPGIQNNSILNERTNLVVLNRTQMPALLIEAAFINNDSDNALFDSRFNEMAQAIADGILDSLP